MRWGLIKPVMNKFGSPSYKFMLAVHEGQDALLEQICQERDISKQELLRSTIIPKWLKRNRE